jgi:Sec-independent protein secretion pathway component TatC
MVVVVVAALLAAPEDLLCTMMKTSPLMMPFVWGILFGMHLVNSKETQVVCC